MRLTAKLTTLFSLFGVWAESSARGEMQASALINGKIMNQVAGIDAYQVAGYPGVRTAGDQLRSK